MLRVLLSSVLLLSVMCHAQQQEILWYKLDFPPYTIKSGEHKNQGLGDKIQHFVSSRMPEFIHRTQFVTASRMYADVGNQKHVCSVNSSFDTFKQDRRGISLPTNIYYNYHLVTREHNLAKVGLNEPVSLGLMLQKHARLFLLDVGRPYQHLDTILRPFIEQNRVQIRNSESLSADLLHMIDRNRADYTLELCSTVRYLSSTEDYQNSFACLEVAEHPKPIGTAAITCSRSYWGAQVVGKINQILLEHRDTEAYKSLMHNWYLPNSEVKQEQYWQHYQREVVAVTSTSLKSD